MPIKRVGLLLALISFSMVSFAQLANPIKAKIRMDIVVVEMSVDKLALLQKQQILWQDNKAYLIRLIEHMYQKDKTSLSVVRSQLEANEGESVVILGNAQTTNKDKRSLNAAHTLTVVPRIVSHTQLSLLLQDQKDAKNTATTGGLAFKKIRSERILVGNKELVLIAVGKLADTRQLVFVTPVIEYKK